MRLPIAFLALVSVLLLAGDLRAGSYLDRATLLVEGARRDVVAVRARIADKELCALVQRVSEARLAAAQKTEVPSQVAKAHPHLLLMLAAVERAAASALEGNYKASLEAIDAAHREELLFRAALKELGHPLPASPKARPTASAPRHAWGALSP